MSSDHIIVITADTNHTINSKYCSIYILWLLIIVVCIALLPIIFKIIFLIILNISLILFCCKINEDNNIHIFKCILEWCLRLLLLVIMNIAVWVSI
jgi:hypothetical protein